jgi:hypothetical protein
MMKIKRVSKDDWKERLVIKTFATSQAGHEFLNKQTNNEWQVYEGDLKSGTYVYAGGEWRNVKDVDRSALAHM